MATRRLIVVGGAGFVGSRVVKGLRERGHEVIVFDAARNSEKGYISGDISRIEDLWQAFSSARPEIVIHLAYLLGEESRSQPFLAARVNATGTLNVFEAARLYGVERVVYASSVTVHGFQRTFGSERVTEGSACVPVGAYAAMKLFNEHMADAYAGAYDMDLTGIRFSNLFGHGRATGSSGPWAAGIVSRPAVGEVVEVPVSPHFRACMLYVDDAAEYVARIALFKNNGKPVYLTGGYDVTIGQLADQIREVVPGAQIQFTGARDDPGTDVPVFLVDNTRIVADTGYELPSLAARLIDHAAAAKEAAGGVE